MAMLNSQSAFSIVECYTPCPWGGWHDPANSRQLQPARNCP